MALASSCQSFIVTALPVVRTTTTGLPVAARRQYHRLGRGGQVEVGAVLSLLLLDAGHHDDRVRVRGGGTYFPCLHLRVPRGIPPEL